MRPRRASVHPAWYVLLGVVAAGVSALLFFGRAVYVPREAARAFHDMADRTQARQLQREQRARQEAQLKDGERCLDGKFIRRIPGGFEDDPAQDWKCRRQP